METIASDRGAGAQSVMDTTKRLQTYYPATVPASIQKLAEDTAVFIFNVGPWQYMRDGLGSYGRKVIEACPDGERHSAPLRVLGITWEGYPLSGHKKLDLLMDENSDGYKTAQAIIGEGPHQAPTNALRRLGVGIARQWPPSKEEIRLANVELDKHADRLIADASNAAAQGPKALQDTLQPHKHFWAARRRNKTVAECPWLAASVESVERLECDACGKVNKVGIMRCSCGFVLDQSAFKRAVADGLFPEFAPAEPPSKKG